MITLTDNQAARLFDGLKAFFAEANSADWLDDPGIEGRICEVWQGKRLYEAHPDTDMYNLVKFRSPNAGYIRIVSVFGQDGFIPDLSNRLHYRLREIVPALPEL